MLQSVLTPSARHPSRAAFTCQPETPCISRITPLVSRFRPFALKVKARPCLTQSATAHSPSQAVPYVQTSELRAQSSLTGDACSHPRPRASLPHPVHWSHFWLGFLATCCITSALLLPPWAWAELPPEPQIGDCPECLGEVNGALNACRLDSSSCVSSENDDADHFIAPWTFDVSRDTAIDQLLNVAQGGEYDPGLVAAPYGIKRADAAKWILGTTANFVLGKPLPEKPTRQISQTPVERFDGRLLDRHTASDGSEYVHLVFGELAPDEDAANFDGSQIVDAEFAFLPNDAVVNVRSSSRLEPSLSDTKVNLSFEFGVTVDQNLAKRRMEQLRKALRWEQVPVISDFDPKFNNEPLWFERIYQPFKLQSSSAPADK